MKNPEKYECGLKYPNAGDFILPLAGISLFAREIPAQNGRVGRYGLSTYKV
jgi:hypothetical protein